MEPRTSNQEFDVDTEKQGNGQSEVRRPLTSELNQFLGSKARGWYFFYGVGLAIALNVDALPCRDPARRNSLA